MNTLKNRSRKESETGYKSQIQMKAWRKKNSSQLNEFQSLYGSLNGSIAEDVPIRLQQQISHNTNSGSNQNNSQNSRSLNRNSSEDSFYSCQSINQNVVKSMSDKDYQEYTDEEFKSIKESNSMQNLSQIIPQIPNIAFQYQQKNTIDEERDSHSSLTNYTFYTPKNKCSELVIDENNLKMSQEIFQQQVQKLSNGTQKQNETQQNNQRYNQKNGQIWLINKKTNGNPSINNQKSDKSYQNDQYQRSIVYNQNQHNHTNMYRSSKEELKSQLVSPLIEGSIKRSRNSVTFTDNNEIMDYFQQSQYQPPSGNKNQANRGKSLSTLKRMIDSSDGQHQQQNSQNNNSNFLFQSFNNSQQLNHSSLILNQQQSHGNGTASINQGKISTNFKQSYNASQQSPFSQMQQPSLSGNVKKISHVVQQSPNCFTPDELNSRKISQINKLQSRHTKQPSNQLNSPLDNQVQDENNRNKSPSLYKGDLNTQNINTTFNDPYFQQFLYLERQQKKLTPNIVHNNRLIDRRKYNITKNPECVNKKRFTLNLTLLLNFILEKQPNLKYLLFLNHFIGGISRLFIYSFLILISLHYHFYFSIFGPCILVTRVYYIFSMYYVLFYPEQKSVSFRKISKIFNNVFYLPSEYKKPVMSEMIDIMDKNQRDEEQKMMKWKFVFCPVEMNYVCMSIQDSRKKWNLFYISNFIYQGIETFCLYPVVIALTIRFHSEESMILGFDFLIFARYIIIGTLSIFFIFCLFLLFHGNKKLKQQ